MTSTATTHVHEVDKRSNALQAGWCACGATFDERKGAWGAPRYTEGVLRRAQWMNNQGREG